MFLNTRSGGSPEPCRVSALRFFNEKSRMFERFRASRSLIYVNWKHVAFEERNCRDFYEAARTPSLQLNISFKCLVSVATRLVSRGDGDGDGDGGVGNSGNARFSTLFFAAHGLIIYNPSSSGGWFTFQLFLDRERRARTSSRTGRSLISWKLTVKSPRLFRISIIGGIVVIPRGENYAEMIHDDVRWCITMWPLPFSFWKLTKEVTGVTGEIRVYRNTRRLDIVK